jgi:hypothetical protein
MPAKTHGLSHSPTWYTWQDMMRRCYQKKRSYYKNYGGRGIKVCKRWHIFENFVKDMGIRPKELRLDRINNDGNYEPSNCRWVTNKENCNNTRRNISIEVLGMKFISISDAARYFKINVKSFRTRMYQYGMTPEEAIFGKKRYKNSRSNKHLDDGPVYTNIKTYPPTTRQ